jgi:hypothetical protein
VYETEPDNFPRLMELMQDVQQYGQPPAEIIKVCRGGRGGGFSTQEFCYTVLSNFVLPPSSS